MTEPPLPSAVGFPLRVTVPRWHHDSLRSYHITAPLGKPAGAMSLAKPRVAPSQRTPCLTDASHPDWPDVRICRVLVEVAGHVSEILCLGNIALRTGKMLHWDGPNLRITKPAEANQHIHREYRSGWTL